MASTSSGRSLASRDITRILYESDDDFEDKSESDISSDEEEVSCYGSDDSGDESSSDEEEDEQAEEVRPTGRKRPRMDTWTWKEQQIDCGIDSLPFIGTAGLARRVQQGIGENSSELDFFHVIFGQDFWEALCTETNRYASVSVDGVDNSPWFDTTTDELKAHFALCVLMGQVKKSSIQSYWSSRAATSTPFFSQIMPLKRFQILNKNFHIANDDEGRPDDKLKKIRPVVDYLNHKFLKIYYPEKDISIDESLMKFRGRLSYVQYNPSKRARFGIKFYKLCESLSGYCTNFSIYTGYKPGTPGIPPSEQIVLDLMGARVRNGHVLFLDRWYSSPLLFLRLKESGTNTVGTVNVRRKMMPPQFQKKEKETMKRGEMTVLFSHQMMAIKWIDKNQFSCCPQFMKRVP